MTTTFVPLNITGEQLSWQATTSLRWYAEHHRHPELQQKWINRSTGATEWRTVELIEEEEDHGDS